MFPETSSSVPLIGQFAGRRMGVATHDPVQRRKNVVMTLVLSALTPRHIVQVSDRRVVLRYRSGGETKRDGHVKAVVTQQFACSYTGVADLAGDTAELACHLPVRPHRRASSGGIESLGAAAGKDCAARGLVGEALAIVCVGWTEHEQQPVLIATVVSNFGPHGIEQRFEVTQITIPEGRPSAVFPTGAASDSIEHARGGEGQRVWPDGTIGARLRVRRAVQSQASAPAFRSRRGTATLGRFAGGRSTANGSVTSSVCRPKL